MILVRTNFALNDVKTDYFNCITDLAPLLAQVTMVNTKTVS